MHRHITKIYSGAHKHVKKSYTHIRKNGRPGIKQMKKESTGVIHDLHKGGVLALNEHFKKLAAELNKKKGGGTKVGAGVAKMRQTKKGSGIKKRPKMRSATGPRSGLSKEDAYLQDASLPRRKKKGSGGGKYKAQSGGCL